MSGYSFKFTFEDGSEALMHYGVKGMKWGQHIKAGDPHAAAPEGGGGGGGIEDEEDEDFNPEDYGYENTPEGRKAARAEMFGPLAEKGKLSREAAMKMAKDDYKESLKNAKGNKEAIKRASETYKLATNMAKTFKTRKEKNAASQRRQDRYTERQLNKEEFGDDYKGLREANRRTDAFYGPRNTEAHRVEAQRRRRSRDRFEDFMRKRNK